MERKTTANRTIRTVRLDDEAVTDIFDKLDANDAADTNASGNRKATRYRYRMKSVVIHMQQPGAGTPIQYSVPTRDLSAIGLSFLHGGFVHPGTKCLVQLITSHGTWSNTLGKVADSVLVEGATHLVWLEFNTPIDPSAYCAEASHSRVLLVDDDASIARLATFHLEQLNADVDRAENGKQAVELCLKSPYDLVLLDIEMPVLNGIDAVKELRSRGYMGMVVAMTALTQPEDQQRCLEAGCDGYLGKPFTRDDLSGLIQSLREEPLFSAFADDPSMADLINGFVMELPAQIRAIEEATVAADMQRLVNLTRHIKASGTSYGFEVLTEAADTIEKAILKGGELNNIREDVDRLVKLCLQARSSARTSTANS